MENRSIAEQRLFLMGKVLTYLRQDVEENISQSGELKESVAVRCEVTGTKDHEYLFGIREDPANPKGLLLQTSVHRKGYDMVVSNYVPMGTKQELLDELDHMIENPEECVEEILQLSDRLAESYE